MAAYAAGVQTVLIPAENLKDMEELDPLVRENLHLIPCTSASDVLANALLPKENAEGRKESTKAAHDEQELAPLVPSVTATKSKVTTTVR